MSEKINEWIESKVNEYVDGLRAEFERNFEGMKESDYEKAEICFQDYIEKKVHDYRIRLEEKYAE